MNEIKTISNRRKVGGDYFKLIYDRNSKKQLKDFISLFNPDDYHIMKTTNSQRIVNSEEFLEYKYSGYTFFKKDKYNLQHIENWLEYIIDMGGINYLIKPLPPFSPNNIIIK